MKHRKDRSQKTSVSSEIRAKGVGCAPVSGQKGRFHGLSPSILMRIPLLDDVSSVIMNDLRIIRADISITGK